jgi:hypothetical protein
VEAEVRDKIDFETRKPNLDFQRVNAFEYYRYPGMIVKYFKIHHRLQTW